MGHKEPVGQYCNIYYTLSGVKRDWVGLSRGCFGDKQRCQVSALKHKKHTNKRSEDNEWLLENIRPNKQKQAEVSGKCSKTSKQTKEAEITGGCSKTSKQTNKQKEAKVSGTCSKTDKSPLSDQNYFKADVRCLLKNMKTDKSSNTVHNNLRVQYILLADQNYESKERPELYPTW